MFQIFLLLAMFILCAIFSLLLSGAARKLFPKFRSGEHKPGTHRPDLPAGGREIKTIELPLVGGPAMIIAMILMGLGAGYVLDLNYTQWTLLLIGLGATLGYALIGFIDDWRKVYSNEGISEKAKFGGVFLVSMIAAALYFFLVPSMGQESYSFYKDLPILNTLLCPKRSEDLVCQLHPDHISYYAWLIFLMLMTGVIGSLTSLSVDFSDGLDGLAGGLVFSAALALAIVITGTLDKDPSIVLEMMALLCASSVLGYLPWNWPSSWAARRGTAKRRAKIYMGDSGALGLGGMLAIIAIFYRNELLLLMIGGAFVLEGLSALISARLLTRFFRKRLQTLRYMSNREFVPHTEFPLPFLATPLHHHFDLLGWDRRRLVYGAWALGAVFAALGVMVNIAPFTWQRYLGRVLIGVIMVVVWFSGLWSKNYFVGAYPPERTRRRRLALYYGYPYHLMGLKLYHLVEIIEASEDVIETPAENIALWQRMNIFDARAMLGLYCYRAGYYPAALAQWTRIPERNRLLRPEIVHLLAEVDNRLALEKQETQPMRLNQLLQKQEPLLTGNLAPADLPNPHEPVRSEEKGDGQLNERHGARTIPIPMMDDDDDEEEYQATAPLSTESSKLSAISGYNGKGDTAARKAQEALTLSSPLQSTPPAVRLNWLTRLLRFPPRR